MASAPPEHGHPDAPVGSPLSVTMEAVAREAKVSRATVSRVLHGTAPVSPKVRAQVEQAVRQLGYVPNLMAQSLAARGSDMLGLLLRDPRNPAYGLLHGELQRHVSAAGMGMVASVPAAGEAEEFERAALERLVGLRVNGLIIATGVLPSRMLEPFIGQVPLLIVGRPESHPRIYSISYDEDHNASTLAHAVANYGHLSVAVVRPTRDVSVSEQRRGTVMADALRARGVSVELLDAHEFGTDREHCDTVIRLVREGRVTAAMFPSDTRMLWFMSEARRVGLRVPEDVSVTGCDGVMPGAEIMGLTTVRIPVEAVAQRAIQVMGSMLQGRPIEVRHERLPGTLVAGSTLAPPKPSA